MRILALTDRPPNPEGHTSGDQMVYQRLRFLASEHEIAFAYLNWANEPAATRSRLFPYQLMALPVPPRPCTPPASPTTRFARLRHTWHHTLFEPHPYLIYGRRQPEVQKAIRALLQSYQPDVIHTIGVPMLYELPKTARPIVAELVDLASRSHWRLQNRVRKPTHRFQYWVEGKKMERVERAQIRRAAVAIVTSEFEKASAQRLAPRVPIEIIAPCLDLDFFQPEPVTPEPYTLLFTGTMNYAPNVEAVEYFCRQILPGVRREIPQVRLVVAGRDPAPSIQALASDSVEITGAVPDIRPYFTRAAVLIVPLLHGGGIRIKILEAWAMEKAVVSTTIGAEGLPGKDHQQLILADTPGEFARAVSALLRDAETRKRLGKCGRQLAAEQFSIQAAARRMNQIYTSVAHTAR